MNVINPTIGLYVDSGRQLTRMKRGDIANHDVCNGSCVSTAWVNAPVNAVTTNDV